MLQHANDLHLTHTPFEDVQIIEQILLISDVDGVIREGVDAMADLRVVHAIKSLLKHQGVDVTFISGTAVDNDLTIEPWRRGNVPLSTALGSLFKQELLNERVAIYGVLGGHCMQADGTLQVRDAYSSAMSFELGKLLILAFLKEVLQFGTLSQQAIASRLQTEVALLESHHSDADDCAHVTHEEFYKIIKVIREHLDPRFRLVTNGALVETHTSNPPWGTSFAAKWLKEAIDHPQHMAFHLPDRQKHIATGYAKKGEEGFNCLLVSKTNKGLTTQKHLAEKLKRFPKAMVVTIGDTQVDFPMHQHAHLAFHVGLKEVWMNHPLPHCLMVCDSEGKDGQHIEGTLRVLQLLTQAIGKSLFDLKASFNDLINSRFNCL